jgi:hypothetical protein
MERAVRLVTKRGKYHPILDITQRQRVVARTLPRGYEQLHEAYAPLVLPVPVSRVHCDLFNHIHVITHLPENAWLLLYHKLSFPH